MTPKLQTGNRVDGPPLPRTFSVVALHDSRLVAVFYAQVTCARASRHRTRTPARTTEKRAARWNTSLTYISPHAPCTRPCTVTAPRPPRSGAAGAAESRAE